MTKSGISFDSAKMAYLTHHHYLCSNLMLTIYNPVRSMFTPVSRVTPRFCQTNKKR